MKRARSGSHGFTIVELLIVVVIISILAAITLATYSGIQQRARDAQRATDLSTLRKALILWSLDNDQPISAMNAGSGGAVVGWFDATYTPYASVQQILINGRYSSANIHDPINTKSAPYYSYMIARCNASDATDVRVLLAHFEVAPPQTVTQQLGVTCTSAEFTTYQTSYLMNYGVLVKAVGG